MNYYSKIAESYDELYKEEQISKIKLIKLNTNLNGLILDIGSGTGFSRYYFKNLVQLEPSFEMLKQSSGLLVCGKAEKLPFKNSTFDSIISITSLHHTNIKEAINEIRRVAKPGCKFAFSILKKTPKFNQIRKELHRNFSLKEIEHEKDLIFVS
jgi:ubiquinone/menaquinone biosynthesis C-methylase UbiE